ncbi:MAG: response regulator [Chloroflexi bacterium]|nr:response regulator [Chloroflexota bacterium]
MAKVKILLVEDDITMVSLLQTLLKMEGFETLALQPDEDITAAVLKEKPGVVLLDVHLSGQSGLEILDQLRSTKGASDARVIMSSGADVKDECLRRGANAFLMKPYMPDDLIAAIKKALNHHS